MIIHIKQLSFEAIIGILDHERDIPQRVVVDIEMDYNYHQSEFINYATVANEVETMIKKNQYQLLEEAVLDIDTYLCKRYKHLLNKLTIEIQKPNIIDNCLVSLSHSRDDF